MDARSDNDYWEYREAEDAAVRAEAELAVLAGRQYEEYQDTCRQRDALDAAFTALGQLPPTATRRVRLTEAL